MTPKQQLDAFIAALSEDPDVGPYLGMLAGPLAMFDPTDAIALLDRLTQLWTRIKQGVPA